MNADVCNHLRSFYVQGERVEVWVNPHAALRLDIAGLREYAARSQWVTMFNAIVLMGSDQDELLAS